jgi:hypothetical protein
MHEVIAAPQNISLHLLDELALANLFGWMAYTIYDDVLDGEIHDSPQLLLSAANFFLRSLTLQYAALDAQIPGLLDEYIKMMNIIDDANAWEQVHCRALIENGVLVLPKELPYGLRTTTAAAGRAALAKLADRSLGHALPALGVLFVAGYAPDSREVVAVLAFFRNYLTARQLHDDAHDWKEDLLRGRVNSVGARLIALWFDDKDKYENENKFDLTKAISDFQKLFWREVIPGVVADIIFFLDCARGEICGSDVGGAVDGRALFKNPAPFLRLIERLQFAAERALRERDEAVNFLETYIDESSRIEGRAVVV